MAMLFFLTSIVIHPTPQKTENQQFELRKETGDKIIYYNIYWREGDSPLAISADPLYRKGRRKTAGRFTDTGNERCHFI